MCMERLVFSIMVALLEHRLAQMVNLASEVEKVDILKIMCLMNKENLVFPSNDIEFTN